MDSELSNQTNNNNEIITDITDIKDLLSVFKNILEKKKDNNPKFIQAIIDHYKNEYEEYLKNSGIVNDHQKLINEYYNNLKSMGNLGFHKTHWDIFKKLSKVRYQLPGFETGSHKETVFGIRKSTSQIIGLKHKKGNKKQPYEVLSKVEIGKMLDNPSEIKKMIKAYTDVIDKIKSNPRELIYPDAEQEVKEEQTTEDVKDAEEAQDDTKEEKKKILVLCATNDSIEKNKIRTIFNNLDIKRNIDEYDIYYIGDNNIGQIDDINNNKFDIIINVFCPVDESSKDNLSNFYNNLNNILQNNSIYITTNHMNKTFDTSKIEKYNYYMSHKKGNNDNILYCIYRFTNKQVTKDKEKTETLEDVEDAEEAPDDTKEAPAESVTAEQYETGSSIFQSMNRDNLQKILTNTQSNNRSKYKTTSGKLNFNLISSNDHQKKRRYLIPPNYRYEQ